MSLVLIRATFECDGCGAQFKVDMRADYEPPPKWALFDVAVDFLRGGCGSDSPLPGVVHDMHLCEDCILIADGVGPEDQEGYSSKDEILEAIARGPHKKKRIAQPQDQS
jgi:hypothetical protein